MTEIVKPNERVPDLQNAPGRGFHEKSGKTNQPKFCFLVFGFFFVFFFLLSFEVLMEKEINTDSTKISAKCYTLCFLFLSTVLDQ